MTNAPERFWVDPEEKSYPDAGDGDVFNLFGITTNPLLRCEGFVEYVRADLCSVPSADPPRDPPLERKWPVRGYAPGGYLCTCIECGERFQGDKRAFHCPDCVIQWLLASRPRHQEALDEIIAAVRQMRAVPASQGGPYGSVRLHKALDAYDEAKADGATPPHPPAPTGGTVGAAAQVLLSALERAQIESAILKLFYNGEPRAALIALTMAEPMVPDAGP